MNGIGKKMAVPLSDIDIKKYLPNAKVIRYSELINYTLDSLLPSIKSFAVILYENQSGQGHWVCISRPEEGTYEFFDSYGGYVDSPLRWNSTQTNKSLGQTPMLSQMFRDSPDEIVYNKIHYQRIGDNVNDCGRWVVLRILMMQKGLNLHQFHQFIEKKKKELKMNSDEVVTSLIV